MVLDVGDTVIEAPVPINEPPQAPAYHKYDAPKPSEPPTCVNVVAPPQVELGLAVAEVGAVETAPDVTVTVTQGVVLQVP